MSDLREQLDARIVVRRDDDVFTATWEGGRRAGISDEMMAYLEIEPSIGRTVSVYGMPVVLVDHLPVGVWVVERVNRNPDSSPIGHDVPLPGL